jgi:hypothetical protein
LYGYVEGGWYRLAGYWLEIWMETGRMNCSQKPGKKCKKLIFDNIPELQIQPSTSQMDQIGGWYRLAGYMDGDWKND